MLGKQKRYKNADGVGQHVRICIDSEIRYLIFSDYDCCLTLQIPSQRENSALPTGYIIFRDEVKQLWG